MNLSAQDKLNVLIEQGAETSAYVKAYVETQVELKKIEASRAASRSLTSIITSVVTAILMAGIFLFLMAAFSVYLSQQFGSFIYGFLAVAGIILFVYLIFLLLKKPLVEATAKKKVANAIFGDQVPVANAEDQLKEKSKELEQYIEKTAKGLPKTVQSLQAKDFVPDMVSLSKTTGVDKDLKKVILQNVLNQSLKIIRKKMSK